jgi:hypothetical protein
MIRRQELKLLPAAEVILPDDVALSVVHTHDHTSDTIADKDDMVTNLIHHIHPSHSPQTEDDPVSAFRINPVYVLIRATDTAGTTLMTTLIADMHPDIFPFIDFSRTKDGA